VRVLVLLETPVLAPRPPGAQGKTETRPAFLGGSGCNEKGWPKHSRSCGFFILGYRRTRYVSLIPLPFLNPQPPPPPLPTSASLEKQTSTTGWNRSARPGKPAVNNNPVTHTVVGFSSTPHPFPHSTLAPSPYTYTYIHPRPSRKTTETTTGPGSAAARCRCRLTRGPPPLPPPAAAAATAAVAPATRIERHGSHRAPKHVGVCLLHVGG
jgi:hypothetical protein